MMGFSDKVKKELGSKDKSQNSVNDEIIDTQITNGQIRNFKYLYGLIHSGKKEIVLDSHIVLSDDEESEYKHGIKLDVDNLIIDGNGHSIDGINKTRIFNINSKVTIKNLTLKSGYDIDGGAINIQRDGDVEITNCQFQKNTAQWDGGAILNQGKLTIAETIFDENSAYKRSGAINNQPNSYVEITNCQFQKNTANKHGGAILNWGKLTITETTFDENSTRKYNGGAIYIPMDGDVEITNCQFQKNTANKKGGAILNQGKLTIAETIFDENSTQENGSGAFYIQRDGGAINIQRDGDVEITNCQFQKNTAQWDGGAIMNQGKLTITESIFDENSTQESYGGAIYIQRDGDVEITNCQFQKNTAKQAGGAISNWGKLTITETTFDENSTQKISGGAINIQPNSDVEITNCQFQKNTAKEYGGAILNWGKLTIVETIFDENSTHQNSGGAISIQREGNVEITNCQFQKNTAKEYGGAIYIQPNSDVEISNCQFQKNTAKEGGGAILNWGKLTIAETIFDENSTQKYNGGAINIQKDGDVEITNCQFQKNTAKEGGGAISNFGKLTIAESIFDENSTQKYNGGAINIQREGDVKITNCQFQKNTAKEYGGAIWVYSKKNLKLKGCTFKDNKPDDVHKEKKFGFGIFV